MPGGPWIADHAAGDRRRAGQRPQHQAVTAERWRAVAPGAAGRAWPPSSSTDAGVGRRRAVEDLDVVAVAERRRARHGMQLDVQAVATSAATARRRASCRGRCRCVRRRPGWRRRGRRRWPGRRRRSCAWSERTRPSARCGSSVTWSPTAIEPRPQRAGHDSADAAQREDAVDRQAGAARRRGRAAGAGRAPSAARSASRPRAVAGRDLDDRRAASGVVASGSRDSSRARARAVVVHEVALRERDDAVPRPRAGRGSRGARGSAA